VKIELDEREVMGKKENQIGVKPDIIFIHGPPRNEENIETHQMT
jgi:hypothetical protein